MHKLKKGLAVAACAAVFGALGAEEAAAVVAAPNPIDPANPANFLVNNVWVMICAGLVFWMNLGFACVETGFTQSKNCTNILFKNTIIPCIGLLTFAICAFGMMFPTDAHKLTTWFAWSGWGLAPPENGMTPAYNPGCTYWSFFLFQAMFAATAATIVSGAVAERIQLSSFLVFTVVFGAISYPITGYWAWGGGWLAKLTPSFHDFAGSTVVHSVGGWAALAGAMILGPRIGKFTEQGVRPILGHSMPLGVIGVFVLWLGWFGFNGGSVLTADPGLTSLVLVTTNIAAAAAAVSATLTTWIVFKKPDLGMMLNGVLAGLVAITAGTDIMSPMEAAIIGLVAGVLVVFAVQFFDKIHIDDPVGALAVHLCNGVWGTLACGIFGKLAKEHGSAQLLAQIKGIVAVGAWTFPFTVVLFMIIKAVMGLRVSEKEELEGLDAGEHGAEAYPDFAPAPR